MTTTVEQAERLLRGWDSSRAGRVSPRHAALLFLLCTTLYGAVMGSFGGLGLQLAFSAIKVPLLLSVSFAISLPSFLVLNTLFGLRRDLGEVLRALLGTQAVLSLILAALSPFTVLWYLSSADYERAILFNGVIFAAASFSAQLCLRRAYAPLVARNRRHRWMLRLWLATYVFVGIQMAWVLRPFVGDPGQPAQLFRPAAWDNAYVIVLRMLI